MAAAAVGTLAYLNQSCEAVESEEEYDLLEDGNVVVSQSLKKSKGPLKSIVDEAPDDEEDDAWGSWGKGDMPPPPPPQHEPPSRQHARSKGKGKKGKGGGGGGNQKNSF